MPRPVGRNVPVMLSFRRSLDNSQKNLSRWSKDLYLFIFWRSPIGLQFSALDLFDCSDSPSEKYGTPNPNPNFNSYVVGPWATLANLSLHWYLENLYVLEVLHG